MKSKSDRAFGKMARAIAAYLETQGWKVLVVGNTRVLQLPGQGFNYDLLVRITASKPKPQTGETDEAN